MSLGSRLAGISERMIRRYGQALTVRNRSTATTRTVWGLPQDVDPGAWSLELEAGVNVNSRDMTQFVIAGDETIAEAIEEISYDGWWMRILAIHGTPANSVKPTQKVLTIRNVRVT